MSRVNLNANVTIRMKGLGIAHYNKKNKNWEFILLRGIPNHDLKVIVREYRKGAAAPIEHIYPISIDEKKIEITTINAVVPPDSQYITDNFAHRFTVDDSRDARWMIDLSEELHNEPVKLTGKNGANGKPIKLTFLSVSDAMLYTDTIYTRPYQMIKNDTEHLPPRVMGGWLGLDIEWSGDDSRTDIKFESLPDESLAPDKDISIYEIEINNDCSNARPNTSDFHYYYDYLVDMPDTFKQNVRPNQSSTSNKVMALTNLLGNDDEDDDGPPKTDDCGFAICSNLDGMNSLEDLVKTAK